MIGGPDVPRGLHAIFLLNTLDAWMARAAVIGALYIFARAALG